MQPTTQITTSQPNSLAGRLAALRNEAARVAPVQILRQPAQEALRQPVVQTLRQPLPATPPVQTPPQQALAQPQQTQTQQAQTQQAQPQPLKPAELTVAQRLAEARKEAKQEAVRQQANGQQPAAQSRAPAVSEINRILSLPSVSYEGVEWTERVRRKNSKAVLRPIQSQMLEAMQQAGGGLFGVGVGYGKSLPALLAGTVMSAKCTLVFTPANTASTLHRTYAEWRQHFAMPALSIYNVEKLSQPRQTDLLEDLTKGFADEDVVVVVDECHVLAAPGSSRTGRILRFAERHPKVRWVFMSGTITHKSIKDFAHLAALALGRKSPLPTNEHDVRAWSQCLDVGGMPSNSDWLAVRPLWDSCYPGTPMHGVPTRQRQDLLRKAFQQRLRSSPGVVCSTETALGTSLVLRGLQVKIPEKITEILLGVRRSAEDPEGEPIPDDVTLWRIERELSQGFYYKWDWPKENGKPKIDEDWLLARRNWNRQVRLQITHKADTGYDSPFLVAGRVAQEVREGHRQPVHRAWMEWDLQRHKDPPPTLAVWVDSFLVDHAVAWARKQKGPVILWYDTLAMGEALREKGLPVFGAGQDPPMGIGSKPVTCGMSIRAHGVGKNLPAWNSQLVISPPTGAKVWEQMLGRTHRLGQEADEVECWVYQHTAAFKEAIQRARIGAQYIVQISGNQQKLLYASYEGIEVGALSLQENGGAVPQEIQDEDADVDAEQEDGYVP